MRSLGLQHSAEFTKAAFKYREGQVYLAKCSEPLPIRWSRLLPKGAEPSTVTVKLSPAGRWTVSLLVEVDPEPLPPVTNQTGIDLGISALLTLSTGEKVTNPKGYQAKLHKLRKAQKALSRKVKGSNNRQKARLRVARVHAEIADARKDRLHKLTTRLVRENQLIAVESLAVKNMMKNPKLARAISDASWGELVRQLEYKCDWYGRTLVKIDRWFPSSKRCNSCGHTVEKLPLNIREWTCSSCDTQHDRDVNAAINILAAGRAVEVCGATVRAEQNKSVQPGARKQKPLSVS